MRKTFLSSSFALVFSIELFESTIHRSHHSSLEVHFPENLYANLAVFRSTRRCSFPVFAAQTRPKDSRCRRASGGSTCSRSTIPILNYAHEREGERRAMRRSRDTRDSNKRGRVFLREYFSVASIRRHWKTDTMPYLYSGISNEKSIGWVLLPLSLFNEELVPPLDPNKILGYCRDYSFQLTRNDDFWGDPSIAISGKSTSNECAIVYAILGEKTMRRGESIFLFRIKIRL